MTDELDDTEARAAEYVLGSLDPAARRQVEQQLPADAELARLVDAWHHRLAPLAALIPPVEPPPAAWLGIAQALVAEAQPAPPARRARRRRGLLHSVGFWRWCTFGASALAAVLALYVAGSSQRAPPAPASRYVAVLNPGDASPALIVTVDPAARRMTIRPLAPAAAPGQALQLWLVAGAATPPQSLGLLDPARATALDLAPALGPSATLAVSLEPPGGSPTGLPTGPILYQGPLLALPD